MNIQDNLDRLDRQILNEIMLDMVNGRLYQEADDITLQMMLEMMSVDKELYRTQGIVLSLIHI